MLLTPSFGMFCGPAQHGGLGLADSAVVFWDERFTSRLITKQSIQERGQRPGKIKRDSGAAAIMLQEILDGLRAQQHSSR